jgi:drug/metabolite transporter (DMT)-like permease
MSCVTGTGSTDDRSRRPIRPVNRQAVLLFAAMSVIWGIPYLFIRIAVTEVSPAVLVFGRTAIAALILLPIAVTRADLRPVAARWRWVVVFAAVEIGLPWLLLGSAEQHVSSSLAALILAGVPLIGTALALLMGRRHHMGWTGALGLLMGILGVAAIVGLNLETTDPWALAELAGVAVAYAVGPVILVHRLGGLQSIGVMSVSLALVAVVYAPFALADWPSTPPTAAVLVSILVLAVVCTALAFILFAALIEAIGPVRSTVITFINPAVATLLGVLVLAEPFTPGMAVGFALVLAGSALATRNPARAPEVAVLEAPTSL